MSDAIGNSLSREGPKNYWNSSTTKIQQEIVAYYHPSLNKPYQQHLNTSNSSSSSSSSSKKNQHYTQQRHYILQPWDCFNPHPNTPSPRPPSPPISPLSLLSLHPPLPLKCRSQTTSIGLVVMS